MSPTKQDHELETLLERYGEAYHQYEHEVQFGDTIGKDEDAERTLRLAEAAVLARMQRPVTMTDGGPLVFPFTEDDLDMPPPVEITDAMVEQGYAAVWEELAAVGIERGYGMHIVRAALEAALREEGEA